MQQILLQLARLWLCKSLLKCKAKTSFIALRTIDLQSKQTFPDIDLDEDEEPRVVRADIKLDPGVQHQLHLVRFDLMQFVNGLHQYIMNRVKNRNLIYLYCDSVVFYAEINNISCRFFTANLNLRKL